MKQITQERLIRAIDKIDDSIEVDQSFTQQTKIIQDLSLRGMQSMIDSHFDDRRQTIWQKYLCLLRRAVNFLRNSITPPKVRVVETQIIASEEDFTNLFESWRAKIDHYHAKREKVWHLQKRYQVTGLTWFPCSFNPNLNFPWVNENLQLLESDLEVLGRWKVEIVSAWLECVIQDGSIFRYTSEGNWQKSCVAELIQASDSCQWAHEWSHTNPRQFNLVLGNGLDTDSSESDTIWFCAVKCDTMPSL